MDSSSDDSTLLDKKPAPPACPAWDTVPAVASGHYAVLGGEELWPPLLSSKVTPAVTAVKAPSSSAAPATPQHTRATTNNAPSSDHHGDCAAPAPERHARVPESSSSSTVHTSNHVNGGVGFRRSQDNGRFAQHPHSRGGGYNNKSRRPVGCSNGRGDVNVHIHINGNGYGNFNGGGFNNNGQRSGRSHPNGYWHGQGHMPSGPRMEPPHHHLLHSPSPPFMGMLPPMMPYYDHYGAYGPYAYSAEYTPQGYYFPPAQEYPMHMMPPQWEPQAAASGPSSSMEQQQQNAPAQLTGEELQKAIRAQIEYYFSTKNLITDTYLRQKMDSDGWVPLTVIADFRRVKAKSRDLDFIMASLLPSEEVEVQDGKIRRRTGWENTHFQEATEATHAAA